MHAQTLQPARRRSVLLLIDVEPDARKTEGGPGGWEGSRASLGYLKDFRSHLEDRTGVQAQFNWFLRADPQIRKTWGHAARVADACPELMKVIVDQGDYCGVHPHLWRWHERRGAWFNDLADPDWTAECLQTAIDAFQTLFRRPPDACRFGDRWLNQHAIDLMQASGIRYDLTVEPGLPDEAIFDDPHATGRLPDYRDSPREPHQPSPGHTSLWMLPLTTTPPVWRLVRRPPYVMKVSRSPNLSLNSAWVWPHLQAQLDLTTDVPLVMVVRSGDLASPPFLDNFLRTTRQLVTHSALPRCEFTNPANAVNTWRALR